MEQDWSRREDDAKGRSLIGDPAVLFDIVRFVAGTACQISHMFRFHVSDSHGNTIRNSEKVVLMIFT